MIVRCNLLLWLVPAIALLAFSAPARAGAGGMGQTGEDVCFTINSVFNIDQVFDPAGQIAAAQAVDPDLPSIGSICDTTLFNPLIVNGVDVLDSTGNPILVIPDKAGDNDCAAFNIFYPGSCALVPEPARFPLAVLVIGSMGIVGYRTYRTRAYRSRA